MKPGPIVYGPQGEQVASLHVPMLDVEENKANARLIASAPELLEALEAVDQALGNDPRWKVSTLRLDIVRVAIAKAKGETL